MKIIFPVEGISEKDKSIVGSFHNTDFACIYSISDGSYEWIATKELSKEEGNLSVELKRKGIQTIICKSMQPMAFHLFSESGFILLQAQVNSVPENVNLFFKNGLAHFSIESIFESIACVGSCNSCASSCS